MSFEPPDGILDIGNATLRVGKLEVAETSGLNQGLQNIIKNDLLITENNESSPYIKDHKWGLKLPTTWVGEFEVKGHSGKYIDFNFYNENSASNAQGYNLTFKDTTMTLRYDNGNPLGGGAATIPTIVGAFRKVNIFFERGVISVSIDGTRYLYHKETDGFNQGLGVASRVVSTTGSAFVNLFIEQNAGDSAFKNLRIVNGRFISDKTSNIAFIGGNLGVGVHSPKESLDILGNMHLTRVSNVSQIKVDSNVVTEYTGPHDRPLRKYPEVAMTANSDKGYVASGSSNGSGSYPEYTAFDGVVTNSTTGWASDATYASGTGISTFSWNGSFGEYLSLELPKALRLQKMFLKGYEHSGIDYQNAPRDIKLYGSNNETNWVLLKTETDLPIDSITNNSTYININATEYYKYIRLQITKTYRRTAGYTRISELEYYGHEEGSGSLDTTLKSVYNVPATTGTQLEVYYDAKGESTVQSPIPDLSPNTNTGAVVGHSPTLDETDGIESFKFNGSSQYVTGTHGLTTGSDPVHTISLWFKRIAKVGQFEYLVQLGQGGTSHQQSAIFLHDDKIAHGHWGGGVYHTDVITDNVWYHIAATFTGGNTSDLSTHKIYVNGVEIGIDAYSSDGPLVLTGTALTLGRNENALGSPGGYFNGSIANFRLYSKVLNADQVKELYDYQKDYFLGSKSQVTLYKGHLGVGVTEPSGQLELAGDERIQEYPPRALTGYETLVEGHGVFCVDFANWYSGNTPWGMYKKNNDVGGQENVWYGPYQNNNGYSGGNVYTGTDFAASTTSGLFLDDVDGTRYYGAWTTIAMPYDIYLKQIHIHQGGSSVGSSTSCAPEDGVILGSNDGTKWYHVHTFTGLQYGGTAGTSSYSAAGEGVVVNAKRPYSHYALITTRTHHNDFTVIIGELRWFGTPGPTTLDKGSLTLGRSLDVPRISRYDVDTETPRPEKLVVDFDTTVNSSPTDISGKGHHGWFNGGAKYSAPDKAFSFDGNGDYIRSSGVTLPTAHSMSVWINMDSNQSGYNSIMHIGTFNTGDESRIFTSGNLLHATIFGSTIQYATSLSPSSWYHVVYTFTDGTVFNTTNAKIYVNGQLVPTTQTQTAATLNLVGDTVTIGATSSGAEVFKGKISNPKLYSVVLEPSEVRKLYNLGRTGRSMIISDTAVGIGKVPEAQLDVRGIIKGQSPAVFIAKANAAMTATAASAIALFGTVITDTAGGWDSVNHRYYAKVPGFYIVNASQFTIITTNVYVVIRIDKNGVENSSTTGFAGPGGYPNTSLTALIYLSVGDYVRCRIGSDTNRTTASSHRLEIVHVGM